MPYKKYIKIYDTLDDLGLLRTPRTYFDSLCHEYTQYPLKDKILDIGYLTWHGYDIRKDVYKAYMEHEHVSEDNVHRGILLIMAQLCHTDYFKLKRLNNSIETDIKLLLEEIMRVYRLPINSDQFHYIANNPREISLNEVMDMNGWDIAASKIFPYRMYDKHNFVTYPGDEEKLLSYNSKILNSNPIDNKKQFILSVCPEPWYGNPIKAKFILLADGPKYDDFISRIQNIIGSHFLQLMEGMQPTIRRWWRLEGNQAYMYEPHDAGNIGINYMDAYNSPNYRRWLNQISLLAKELSLSPQKLYNSTAVINATPYLSEGNSYLSTGLLPSHYFLRHLIKYLVNSDSNRIFIIPSISLERIWKEILGDVYTDLKATNRFLLIQSPNPKYSLSKKYLTQDSIERILNA
ncbi:MAG: hypothetical protein K2H60_12860 [Muribaculaceae bacterium]|nr:hypothetical protein [Muribaculaceae bacterium]